jgi:hypothetical protein
VHGRLVHARLLLGAHAAEVVLALLVVEDAPDGEVLEHPHTCRNFGCDLGDLLLVVLEVLLVHVAGRASSRSVARSRALVDGRVATSRARGTPPDRARACAGAEEEDPRLPDRAHAASGFASGEDRSVALEPALEVDDAEARERDAARRRDELAQSSRTCGCARAVVVEQRLDRVGLADQFVEVRARPLLVGAWKQRVRQTEEESPPALPGSSRRPSRDHFLERGLGLSIAAGPVRTVGG